MPHPVRLAGATTLLQSLDLPRTQEEKARRFAHGYSSGYRIFDDLHASKLMRTEFGSVGYFR
jgi:hypothetical protein